MGTRDFLAVDVSDPAKPKILKRVSDRPRIDYINAMVIRGEHVLTANKSGYITVFDVSEPANPAFVDSFDARARGGLRSPHDIALVGDHGDHIVVVNAGDAGDFEEQSEVNVRVFGVADPATHQLLPVSEWTIEGLIRNEGKLADNLSGANRVAVAEIPAGALCMCGGFRLQSGRNH